jgi:streptogramin lyase
LRSLLAAALAGVVAALCLAASAGAARPGVIQEFPLGSSQRVYLFGLTTGSDGAIWFADLGCAGLGRCGIGRINSSGRVSLYTRGLNAGSVPFQIALGPDGNLWFTDEGSRPAIGRVTPSGAITEFSRGLTRDSTPFAITLGPGHDLWFTSQGRRPAIGRITPRGRITLFFRGLRGGSAPFGIAATRHGLWFTDHGCAGGGRCQLGRVTATGQISQSRTGLRSDTDPLAMAAGFGDSVWFADGAGSIGEIGRDGHVSEHPLPAGSAPAGIAAGADGNMWFTDEGSHPVVGRISPAGSVRTFSARLDGGSLPAAISPAPDGDLWFTDEGGIAAVGRIATGAPPALGSVLAPAGRARPGQTLTCRPTSFAAWDQLAPVAPGFGFDGDRWLRDGIATGVRGPLYHVRSRDAGHRLACRVTATYPTPFLTTAVGRSPAVTARR